MKKLIITLALILGFGITASAQTKKTEINKDIEELSTYVNIDPAMKNELYIAIATRNEEYTKVNSTEERKIIFNRYAGKIIGVLTPAQKEMLSKNPDLYKKLTVYTGK